MPEFLFDESPTAVAVALAEALDLIDLGVLLLTPDLRVRFMNRKQIDLWKLALPNGASYRELMVQIAALGLYEFSPNELPDYLDLREEEARCANGEPRTVDLTDGRRVVIRCMLTPEGGRMLTYTDQTSWRELENAQTRALEEAERRDADQRFASELLESQGAHLASLAETAAEDRSRLEEEIARREVLETELRRLATTDPLTGLFNRGHFLKTCAEVVQQTRQRGDGLALAMVDVDHFKSINDRFGHQAGDDVLREIATCLGTGLRSGDCVGRLGGEEFAVALPRMSAGSAFEVADRLRTRISEASITVDGVRLPVTVSVGLAMLRPSDEGAEQVLARADAALYRAKREGRNQVRCSEEAAAEQAAP